MIKNMGISLMKLDSAPRKGRGGRPDLSGESSRPD